MQKKKKPTKQQQQKNSNTFSFHARDKEEALSSTALKFSHHSCSVSLILEF